VWTLWFLVEREKDRVWIDWLKIENSYGIEYGNDFKSGG